MTTSAIQPGLFTEADRPGQEIRLCGSRCDACGRLEFPATPDCVSCGGPVASEELPVDAVLVGFSSVQYAPPGARIPVPYDVGVARFGDDLCVMGLLDPADPAGLEPALGQSLRTVAVAVDEETLTYGFRPAN